MKTFTVAFIVGLAFCTSAPLAATGPPSANACHPIAELASKFAPADKMVSYTFKDLDAHKIIGALVAEYGPPPGNVAVTVVLAYATVAGLIDIFLYDEAGCYTAHAPESFDLPMIQELFDFLDITLPIGATFYQLPGIKA